MVRLLPLRPAVAIYSARTLALNAPNVVRVNLDDKTYPYRYEGLRLLMIRGDRYYLVPVMDEDEWRRGNGRTVILSEKDGRRVEILPGVRTT